MRLSVTSLSSSTKQAPVMVGLEVTAPALNVRDVGLGVSDTLNYLVLAASLPSGHIASLQRNTATVTGHLRSGTASLTYEVVTALTLPAGEYQVRAAATSERLAKGGSVYATIDVPDFSKPGLRVSGLAIGEATVPVAASPAFAVLRAAGAPPFAPTLDRAFSREGGCRVFGGITRGDGETPIKVSVELVDRTDHTWSMWSGALDRAAQGYVDQSLSFATVPPGAYCIRMTARQGEVVAHSEVGILGEVAAATLQPDRRPHRAWQCGSRSPGRALA